MFRRIAIILNIVDIPNQAHKTHKNSVPYLGGLSIVLTVDVGIIIGYLLLKLETISFLEIAILICPPNIMAIVGLIDDVKNLRAVPRLLVQVFTSIFVILIFTQNGYLGTPSGNSIFNFAISSLWIIGITNSLNFIDNLDGGAAGVSVIAAVTLLISSLGSGQALLASLSALLLGSTFGFLIWNFYPAKIYLGDSGALFVGFILATLVIRLSPTGPNRLANWCVAFLILAIPILDTSVAVLSRLKRRISPFLGGRDHLSHRLITLGLSRKQSAISIWLLALFFAAIAIALQSANTFQALVLELLAGLSWLILLIAFIKLDFIHN